LIGNILAEDNSGNKQYDLHLSIIDSDNDDTRTSSKMEFTARFPIGASYGGAFSNIPERVGSAPATDITVVRKIFVLTHSNIEIWKFRYRISSKQKQTSLIW
jgi:hypothetical protein